MNVIWLATLVCINYSYGQLVVNIQLPSKESYLELYETSLKHYSAKKFYLTQYYTEFALADKRYRDIMLLKCNARCSEPHVIETQQLFFLSLVTKEKCTKTCMRKIFGEPLQLPLWIIKDFKVRKPYSFLQYAYYKTDDLAAAYEAAIINLKYNSESEMMQKNVRYYGSVVEKRDGLLHEQQDSSDMFRKGMGSYSRNLYELSTEQFNASLSLHIKEITKCKTLCETGFDQYADRKIPNLDDTNTFYEQFVKLYHKVMECRYNCVAKYDKAIEAREDYLPQLLNYLQFSAFYSDKVEFAAQIAAGYLYISPGDQTMANNLDIFLKSLERTPDNLQYLHDFADQNNKDLEVLAAIVGKREMRKRLKDKQNYILGDLGLVSELNPDSRVLWTNSY